MNNKVRFFIGIALLTLGVTSCKEDYFDPEAYRELVSTSFPVENVDPNHTWKTMNSAKISVKAATGTGDSYEVKIYNQNPLSGNKEALTLLANGYVADGQTTTLTATYALSSPLVYVTLYDSQRFMTVIPGSVANGNLNVEFGGAQQNASRAFRTIESIWKFPSKPSDEFFLTAVPAGVKSYSEVSPWGNGYGSGVSYIDENHTGDVNIWGGWDGTKNSGGTLYIKGNCDFSNRNFNVAQNTDVYLIAGATLKLSVSAAGNLQGGCHYYIAPGARLEVVGGDWGGVKLNNGLQMYNRGTIVCPKFEVNNTSMFYNEGTLTVNGELSVENSNSVIVNDGTITATRLHTAGSGHVQNNAEWTISGNTDIDSNNNTWVNNGTYTTGNFFYTAGSCDVINNCRLFVTELFKINLGDTNRNGFRMDAGSSVVAKNFLAAGPSYVFMGENSVFLVEETATMNITKALYGIYGPENGGYAVFQAKEIAHGDCDPNQGFVASYYNHLYVATDKHFAFGYSDKSLAQQAAGEVGSQPYYYLDAAGGAVMTGFGGAKVTIAASECNPGYGGVPTQEPNEQRFSLRYCFEDNFPQVGDYDFNDVVVTLTPIVNGRTVKLKVSLDAVGASEQVACAIRISGLKASDIVSYNREGNLDANFPGVCTKIIRTSEILVPDNMKYYTNDVVLNVFSNAHWAMNPEYASNGSVLNWFYNTVERNNALAEKKNDVAPAVLNYTFELASEEAAARFTQDYLDVFIIESYNGGFWEVHTMPFKTTEVLNDYASGDKSQYSDNFPWAICVPGNDFKYPIEWQTIGTTNITRSESIGGAYQTRGHSFVEWAQDHTQATDWYMYPTKNLVYE